MDSVTLATIITLLTFCFFTYANAKCRRSITISGADCDSSLAEAAGTGALCISYQEEQEQNPNPSHHLPKQPHKFSREEQSGSGTVDTFRWQSADDYGKDNALHVSNNWQIIYVIFSAVISVEGANLIANIKPPAEQWRGRPAGGRGEKKRRKNWMCYKRLMERGKNREREEWIGGGEEVPGSAFFFFLPPRQWRCTAICEGRQTRARPSFVQHLTWCEGFSPATPTCVADDVCVSSVPWLLACEPQSNALHLISSTGCAPRWVRNSPRDGSWHAAQPGRTGVNIIQCIFTAAAHCEQINRGGWGELEF